VRVSWTHRLRLLLLAPLSGCLLLVSLPEDPILLGDSATPGCDTADPAGSGGWLVWPDSDGDGFGDPEGAMAVCAPPSGTVENDGDCDDTSAAIHPGAEEVWYDGVDSDCDGGSDYDADGDGQDAEKWGGTDCDDADPDVLATTWWPDSDGDGLGASEGVLRCEPGEGWADNNDDCLPDDPLRGCPRWVAVDAGYEHSCAITTEGAVECWGRQSYGEAESPEADLRFTAVSADGYAHSCGLLTDSTIACWGNGWDDADVPPSGTFEQVATSGSWSCGLAYDGVECWGREYLSRIETAPTGYGLFESLVLGSSHGCVLRYSGSVECWGKSWDGQTDVPEGTFTAIAAGRDTTCGLLEGGGITCWGLDSSGQGSPPAGTYDAISQGSSHGCALDGTEAVCWGSDYYGTLQVPEGVAFVQISAGSDHTCGIDVDGYLLCWGNNEHGQAGTH
jgi:alpha-tubulin suppressor-like RCC1 family protein